MPRSVEHGRGTGTEDAETVFEFFALLVWRVAGWVLRLFFMVARWVVLFPVISLPTLAVLLSLDIGGPWAAAFLAGFTLALLGAWRVLDAASFRAAVTHPVAARWRRWRVYAARWAQVCALHELAPVLDGHPVIPRLGRVRIGGTVDELQVGLVIGQTVADWSSRAEALAHAFGAQSATVSPDKPGRIRVLLRRLDGLTAPVPLTPPAPCPDLEHVVIGAGEDGTPWAVRVLGRHLLVAGATGSGKGAVVWSLLAGIAPLLHDGTAEAWVIDPKGGMEFGQGAALFTRFAYDTGAGALSLLRDAAETLRARADGLRGESRQHEPTPDDPLIVVVIDELAALTAYQTDRKLANELGQLLALILSQGRAVGVTVIAAVQDPSKDVVGLRQLFPTRIGLRLAEATQVDMVLGAGARAAGALCEQIPDSLPGIGYVMEDGCATPYRARAFHVTDPDIHALAAAYAPRSPVPVFEPPVDPASLTDTECCQ